MLVYSLGELEMKSLGINSNFSGDLDKRRSLTGYVFIVGGCAISWKATLQNIVALSTTKLSTWLLLRVVRKLFG